MLREAIKNHKLAGTLLQVGNEFLLCKRAPDQGTLANHWTVPSGHVEPGESPRQGAIREFQEETQISLSVDHNEMGLLSESPSISNTGTYYLYHAKAPKQLTPTLDDEHTDWGYFTVDSLPEPISSDIAKWISKLS